MKLCFVAALLATIGLQNAFGQDFGVVPNDGHGNVYPSVCADGTKIAYLTETSGGTSTVKVYDTTTSTQYTVSTGVPYCSRPRIARDGNHITYFGTYYYGRSGISSIYWMVVVPIVVTRSSGGGWGSPA
ncbi:MAG TPA: hypothetical protein VHE55_03195 [Fimbriimonadaceae bacterium]|nr:hypothetical protein [Fimbriimonadaceae bacterium]